MAPNDAHVPFDPNGFDDELLIVLAQCGSRLAKRELMSRHYRRVRRKISFLARKMELPRQEVADVQEQGMIWLDDAIRRHKAMPSREQRGRSFPAFFIWLLEKRFLNFMKRYHWIERHFDQSERAVRELERVTAPTSGPSLTSHSPEREESSAARFLEEDEFRARLEWAVKQLRPQLQDLWACLKAGRKLKWIAKDLGVSERTIRRWKAELQIELQRKLGELSP